mmetsp:Transcript_5303/g.15006  ORF Transcript_5303/g.15006 Transcript_5303/m.15006 type:complete len:458 (-) Transcript_5303:560-1933(-)
MAEEPTGSLGSGSDRVSAASRSALADTDSADRGFSFSLGELPHCFMLSTADTTAFCLHPRTFRAQPTKSFIWRFASTSGWSGTGGRIALVHLSAPAQADSSGPPSKASASDGQPCGHGASRWSISLGYNGAARIGGISTGIEKAFIFGGLTLDCQSCSKPEASAITRHSPLQLTSKLTAPSVGALRQYMYRVLYTRPPLSSHVWKAPEFARITKELGTKGWNRAWTAPPLKDTGMVCSSLRRSKTFKKLSGTNIPWPSFEPPHVTRVPSCSAIAVTVEACARRVLTITFFLLSTRDTCPSLPPTTTYDGSWPPLAAQVVEHIVCVPCGASSVAERRPLVTSIKNSLARVDPTISCFPPYHSAWRSAFSPIVIRDRAESSRNGMGNPPRWWYATLSSPTEITPRSSKRRWQMAHLCATKRVNGDMPAAPPPGPVIPPCHCSTYDWSLPPSVPTQTSSP